MVKAVILGASGPTGIHLAPRLLSLGHDVRVVSRSAEHLEIAFADLDVERLAVDLRDPAATAEAVADCDLVFLCVGLPMSQIHLHPLIARNVATAADRAVRIVHVSSYWSYLPLRGDLLSETHPREGGGLPIRARREAEDILVEAGAAIVHLPDFYGPHVHVGTLQGSLTEAVERRPMQWLGKRDIPREYLFVPDAMDKVTALMAHEETFGQRWVLSGPGPITFEEITGIVERALGREVRVRALGPTLLRLLSPFHPELRAIRPLLPSYLKPLRFDERKLRALIGEHPVTPYAQAVAQTLEWLQGQRAAFRS
jgi:nucleoside-diphosphate-sugar epimerase